MDQRTIAKTTCDKLAKVKPVAVIAVVAVPFDT